MQLIKGNSSGGGVWQTYGVDSENGPFSHGVTVGNGRLVAKWWQEKAVAADFATPPFLIFIHVALVLGSTSSIDEAIVFQGPFGMSGSGLEIDAVLGVSDNETPDDFFPLVPTHAMAYDASESASYAGIGISNSDATVLISTNADAVTGPRWTTTVPFTWAEGDMLTLQRTYYGRFYGD